jgi:hypothetical protein
LGLEEPGVLDLVGGWATGRRRTTVSERELRNKLWNESEPIRGPNEIWQADHSQLDLWVSEPGWHVCGIPDTFYTDHGSDFTSQHLEQVAADLKIPWDAAGFLPHLPDSIEQLDLLLLIIVKPRKVHPGGIHLFGLRSLDTIVLGEYVGEPVTIRTTRATSPRSASSTTTGSCAGRSAPSWRRRLSASRRSPPPAALAHRQLRGVRVGLQRASRLPRRRARSRSAAAPAPVKFGMRPAAPGTRATRSACIADHTSCRRAAFSAGPPASRS